MPRFRRPTTPSRARRPGRRRGARGGCAERALELLLKEITAAAGERRERLLALTVDLFGDLGHEHTLTIHYRRRLAGALAKRDGKQVRIFLMGDAVGCALQGQVLPDGYYHLDRMLSSAIRRGADVGCCGTCMDARAIDDAQLVDGARRSTLEELTDWTLWADKVITF